MKSQTIIVLWHLFYIMNDLIYFNNMYKIKKYTIKLQGRGTFEQLFSN